MTTSCPPLYATGTPWFDQSLGKQLATAIALKEAGLDGYEVLLFDPVNTDCKEFGAGCRGNGIKVAAIGFVDAKTDPGSEDVSVRNACLDLFMAYHKRMAELGATVLLGPMVEQWQHFVRELPEEAKVAQRSRVAETFKKIGDSWTGPSRIALEFLNRFELQLHNTEAELAVTVRGAGNSTITGMWDTAHAMMESDPRELLSTVKGLARDGLLGHIHVSAPNRRDPMASWLWPNLPYVIQALQEMDYQGGIGIEVFVSRAVFQDGAKQNRPLDGDPFEIVVRTANELRKLWGEVAAEGSHVPAGRIWREAGWN